MLQLSFFKTTANSITEQVKSLLPGSSWQQNAQIVIEDDSSITSPQKHIVKRNSSDIIKSLEEKNWSFALLFFAVIIRLLFNKAVKNGRCSKLSDIIYSLREYLKSSKLIQEAASKYKKKDIFFIIDMCLIIFFCELFGKRMQQFLEDINKGVYYTLSLRLHLPMPIHPQRICEFKSTLGESLTAAIILEIKEYFYSGLALFEVDDSMIEFVSVGVSLSANVSKIYNHYGFGKFLNFCFWHGLFAQIEACIPRKRKQKKYSVMDLLFTYLTKLVEHGENMDDLEKELKNSIEQSKQIINPCAQSFRDLLSDLDVEELKEVQKHLACRVSRLSLKKGMIVSIDWTLIPVRGHHSGAYKCWDHVTNKQVTAYKLHVLFNSRDKQPLAFVFEEKDQTPTQVLKGLIEQTRQLLGVNHLGLVLYDKGYYEVESMKQIGLFEQLISPGKKFSAIKKAIEDLNLRHFVGHNKDGNMLFDTTVYFKEADLTLRLVVVKTYTEQYVRTKSGNKKMVNGNYIRQRIVTFHSYLTNIPKEALDAVQVVENYAKRWSIEHFFKELNNYGLKTLPSTDYRIVQNHVAIVMLMYMLVTLFKKALGGRFTACSLKTLNKNFFRAPIVRIKKEHSDLFSMLHEVSKETYLLNCLYQDRKLLPAI